MFHIISNTLDSHLTLRVFGQHCRLTLCKYDSWYRRNTRHHKRVSDPNNHSDAATGTLSRPPLQLLTSAPIRCSPTYPPPSAGHLCVSAFIQSSHNPPLSSLSTHCLRTRKFHSCNSLLRLLTTLTTTLFWIHILLVKLVPHCEQI